MLTEFNLIGRHAFQRFIEGFFGQRHGLPLQFLGFAGQVDHVDAPVGFVRFAFDQSQFFQVVDQPRNTGFVTKGGVAQFLLAFAVFLPKLVQNAPLFDGKVEAGLVEFFLQPPGYCRRGLAGDEKDRRINKVYLTKTALRLHDQSMQLAEETLNEALEGVPAEQINLCKEVLQKVYDNLNGQL